MTTRRPSLWPLRLLRLGVFVSILLTLHFKIRESHREIPAIQKEEILHWFPQADSFSADPSMDHVAVVKDVEGNAIGKVLSTYPEAQSIVGYAGPTECLIALTSDDRLLGIKIRRSADTEAHVQQIQEHLPFFRTWEGMTWFEKEDHAQKEASTQKVLPVSGSTLTSLSIIEGILAKKHAIQHDSSKRVTWHPGYSLRFPEALSLEDARISFPQAAQLEEGELGEVLVMDEEGNWLGTMIRSSPISDGVGGHQGPSDTLAALDREQRIQGIQLRESFDTEEYVENVQQDAFWATVLNGMSLEELAEKELQDIGLEGVAGATQTSYAMAEGLRLRAKQWVEHQRARTEAANSVGVHAQTTHPFLTWFRSIKGLDWMRFIGLVGALVMTYSHLRGKKWARHFWSLFVIATFGIWNADFLSLSLWNAWINHGVPWQQMPGLVLLTLTAFLIPWSDGKQMYCHHLCPHGLLQGWIGKIRKPIRISSRMLSLLEKVPWMILLLAVLSILFQWNSNFSEWEAFDAWVPSVAAWTTLSLAIFGLILSFWIPQAYCRFGCPTGALLKWIRTGGPHRLGTKDYLSLVILSLAIML